MKSENFRKQDRNFAEGLCRVLLDGGYALSNLQD